MNFTFNDMFPLEQISYLSLIFYVINWIFFIYLSFVNYKRHGMFSFTFLWMFFSFFIGILFPFFFAFSELNRFSSPDIYLYSQLTNDTFLISSVGFYAFIVGACLSNKVSFMPIGLIFTYKSMLGFLKHSWANYVLFFILIVGIAVLVTLNVPFGQARAFAMENPSLRPLINLFTSIYAFLLFIIWLFVVYYKRPIYCVFFIILCILNLWSGTRSALLFPMISMIATLSIVNKSKNFFKYIIYGLLVLFLVILIKSIRDGADNISVNMAIFEMFFGNTFSDLRDFTWIYYYWDSELLLGKTYLAGIMSFIPSYISEYREVWSWGRWSTGITYLNQLVHPGLRPGAFGEMFFNFGYFGVIGLGFFIGLCIGRLDKLLLTIKRDGVDKKELLIIVGAFFIYYGMLSSIVISAGYFNLYLKIAILFLGFLSFRIKIK